jgi:anti-anti-sigma factor
MPDRLKFKSQNSAIYCLAGPNERPTLMPIQEWSERIWVVQLGDEPMLSDDLRGLKDRVEQAKQAPDMVLDLSGLALVNSSNLSQLLRLRKLAADRDVKLRLAGPPNSVWAVFLTTGLDKVFEFVTDVPSALAGLQMNQ